MNTSINILLNKKVLLDKSDIVTLLNLEGDDMHALLSKALETKLSHLDNTIHLRGLIEYSNICRKSCLYCGIRSTNPAFDRYTLTDKDVSDCVRAAIKYRYGSIAIQSGERQDKNFVDKIASLIREAKRISGDSIGITLSCGEQSKEVYREWFNAGAHRYLLRIEASDKELFSKIHPNDSLHKYENRINAIESLLQIGYQTGSGVMIGLPFQSAENLADDLIFFKKMDLAMVGMGPFIPHPDTPLWQYRNEIPQAIVRMNLTLKMIAVLRLMMPEINMVASTADQTIFPTGRNQAVLAGANVIMPNLTPDTYRTKYLIYPDKANVKDTPEECNRNLEQQMQSIGHKILYGKWGDSKAFINKHGENEPH